MHPARRASICLLAVANQGEGRGGPGPPLTFGSKWGLKGRKNLGGRPPLSKGLDGCPPPPLPPYPPLSQGLDSAMSWVMERKGGSAWIMSNLWSRPRSPNFWTSQSRSLSLQTVFFECEYPLIDMTDGHNWARCCKRMAIRPGFDTIQATCCACSKKILLDSCRVFLSRKPKKGSADRVILFVSIQYDEPAAQQPDTLSLLSNKKKSIFVCLAGKLSEFRTLLL